MLQNFVSEPKTAPTSTKAAGCRKCHCGQCHFSFRTRNGGVVMLVVGAVAAWRRRRRSGSLGAAAVAAWRWRWKYGNIRGSGGGQGRRRQDEGVRIHRAGMGAPQWISLVRCGRWKRLTDDAVNCDVDCAALVIEADRIEPSACITHLRRLALDGGRRRDSIIPPIRA